MVYPHYLIEEGTTAESVWGRIVTVGGGGGGGGKRCDLQIRVRVLGWLKGGHSIHGGGGASKVRRRYLLHPVVEIRFYLQC